MSDYISQHKRVVKHLRSGASLTAVEAVSLYGCTRLASVVERIRKTEPVHMIRVPNKSGRNWHARYYMDV